MAFLLEDGTGLANSNSYSSVDEYKAHHTDRGTFEAGDNTDTEIEQGLVNASDYIDKRFGRRFRGYRRKRTQAMEWPRIDAFDEDDFLMDDVPTALKRGTNEYAWLWLKLQRNLAPMPGTDFPIVDPTTGEVTSHASGSVSAKKEKVGPIEEATEYSSTASEHPMTSTGNLTQRLPEYPQADLWIEELLRSTGNRELARG